MGTASWHMLHGWRLVLYGLSSRLVLWQWENFMSAGMETGLRHFCFLWCRKFLNRESYGLEFLQSQHSLFGAISFSRKRCWKISWEWLENIGLCLPVYGYFWITSWSQVLRSVCTGMLAQCIIWCRMLLYWLR